MREKCRNIAKIISTVQNKKEKKQKIYLFFARSRARP